MKKKGFSHLGYVFLFMFFLTGVEQKAEQVKNKVGREGEWLAASYDRQTQNGTVANKVQVKVVASSFQLINHQLHIRLGWQIRNLTSQKKIFWGNNKYLAYVKKYKYDINVSEDKVFAPVTCQDSPMLGFSESCDTLWNTYIIDDYLIDNYAHYNLEDKPWQKKLHAHFHWGLYDDKKSGFHYEIDITPSREE